MASPVLLGEIEAPRPLHAVGGRLSLAGWCVISSSPEAPAMRARAGLLPLAVTSGLPRPDVASLLPHEPTSATSGFRIEGTVPPGVHELVVESCLPDGVWRVFKWLSLLASPPPFTAVLDEPVRTGTLRDRVKVGGWALDPRQPVVEVSLRYGHRTLPCGSGLGRLDVPAAFPDIPHAASAGFASGDFLVAGHGPVRIRARLADGRVEVANTPVTFSIATDENHEAELDLTAPRIGLPVHPPRERAGTASTERPRNILFLLPGSFASNSALHVAALANELTISGHDCLVAVAHDADTLVHLDRPAFRGLTHAEARRELPFANRQGPDIVHAWTTRENVRLLAEELRTRHGARMLVHLEDNEQQVLASTLNRPWAELLALPATEIDRLVPPDLSHPRRGPDFLAKADGVTVIMDRLRDFVPNGRPCLTLTPAMDRRWFFPRPIPEDFRAALRLPADTTVLFYHGNVHAANADEVRELYAAVVRLNREQASTVLIRTGLDRIDFLGALAAEVTPYVISLGQITHHHHLPALMSLADMFVQPGRADAFNDYRFPSKLPEFFALGRPVILPRTNLGRDLRHRIDAYVLDDADATGIARAVRDIRRDPSLAERLAAGARACAEARFDWTRSAAELAKFHAALTGS